MIFGISCWASIISILLSCKKSGQLHKEGSSVVKGVGTEFKDRLFVLWRHPQLITGPYTLLWYESETDETPKGHQRLPVGSFTVAPPRKRRKVKGLSETHCFRIDVDLSSHWLEPEEMAALVIQDQWRRKKQPEKNIKFRGERGVDTKGRKFILATDSASEMASWMDTLVRCLIVSTFCGMRSAWIQCCGIWTKL